MHTGLFVATALAAGTVGVIAATGIGLGMAAAHRVGSAYGTTVEQMYEQQRMADYYNQQSYYQYPGGSNYHYHQPGAYYQPKSYHRSRHSYGYNY